MLQRVDEQISCNTVFTARLSIKLQFIRTGEESGCPQSSVGRDSAELGTILYP